MSRELDECLSAQTLASYVNGALSASEKAEVDRHLDECRLCAGAVEGVAALESTQDYLKSADSLQTRLRLRAVSGPQSIRQSSSLRSLRPYFALAASLVVVVGLTAYLTRPSGHEALFHQHFEPYPSTQPTVRGGVSDATWDAMLLYESRDYRGALARLENAVKERPNDPTARFYAGVCQLALDRTADAIGNLEETRKLAAGELDGPAEWYLALAYLRNGNTEEAHARLARIDGGGGFYADRARALLRALAGS